MEKRYYYIVVFEFLWVECIIIEGSILMFLGVSFEVNGLVKVYSGGEINI